MSPPGEKAGHEQVFAEVVKQQGFIRRFAASCGVRAADLDDFVQSTLLTAWLAIMAGKWAPPDPSQPLSASVQAWLSGIVKRKASDHRRKNRTRSRIVVHADIDVVYAVMAELTPEDHLLSLETLDVLAKVKLSPHTLAVVLLAAQGYPMPEIAERLRIPVNTAWTHLRRARMKYQKALRRG